MPFLRVDAYEGRSKDQVKELLDAIHRAILSAFGVPLRDRYQVYQEHSESSFIVQDTGLGIDRTKNVVFIGITSRQRTEAQKINLYIKLVEELRTCGIEPNDIVVSIVASSDADWSFGNGRAQFLTGEL
jgi:phenylpyruvate tautomerase PptA (4-oxalocrotonate tautomerase family)